VIVGGFLRPGYSHYYNSISELTVAGSKHLLVLTILFFIYNISLILIGIAPAKAVNTKLPKSTLRLIGLMGLLGVLMYFFPQDPRGAAVTTAGTMHIILAGLLSLLTIVVTILAGFVLRDVERKKLAVVSWILAAIIIITGGITAISVTGSWRSTGLWERLTIGTFLVWLPWFAIYLKRIIKTDYI
jgi:hypothetical protein